MNELDKEMATLIKSCDKVGIEAVQAKAKENKLENENIDKAFADDSLELLKGCADIIKSLFSQGCSISIAKEAEALTKKQLLDRLSWAVRELKELREIAWIVSEELPDAKDAFEKKWASCKAKCSKLLSEYNSAKKSVDDSDLHKGLITTKEVNLIQSVDDNKEIAKSIETGECYVGGRPGADLMKSVDENLKNTHGEQFHTDADKKVIEYLTTTGEIKLDKIPREYQLPEYAYANSKKSDTEEADLKKAEKEKEEKDDSDDDTADKDEATKEMEKEQKKGETKGQKENPFDKSLPEALDEAFAVLFKGCKDLDELQSDAHKKAKKIDVKDLHENSSEVDKK